MAWSTPKTNWAVTYDAAGKYTGDWVNIGDYNRIKNNIAYIHELAELVVYDTYPSMGADKTYLDYPRASEWNRIEQAINQLAVNIGGTFPAVSFMDNGFTPDYMELNRIESMIAQLKVQYETAVKIKYRFPFTLGRERSVIRV